MNAVVQVVGQTVQFAGSRPLGIAGLERVGTQVAVDGITRKVLLRDFLQIGSCSHRILRLMTLCDTSITPVLSE